MQAAGTRSLVPDTPTPVLSQNSSISQRSALPTSLRPLRSRDVSSSMRGASNSLPASPGLQGINVDVSMESDRRGRFDENSPRYGSAALRSSFVKRPSNLRAHISEDSDDQEDDSGSLRIRMGHGHQNKGQPDLRSPSLSAMSSPQRPAYRSVTHDSPVSGFDGMARELRREFERITNAQQHNPSSAQSSPAASHRTSYPTATGLKSPNANLGRRVFADVSNQRDSSPSYSNDGLKQPQSHQRQASFKSPRSKSNPQPLRVHQDDHVFRSSPRHPGTDYVMPDVTGLTEGLTSPEKGRAYRKLATPDKRSQASEGLGDALGDLEDKLNTLEDENNKSTRRIKQLEAELRHQRDFPNAYRKRDEHDSAIGTGTASSERFGATRIDLTDLPTMPSQYRAEEEGVYKDLVERLHAHVARLTKSLGTHSKALEELKDDAAPRSEIDAMRQQMSSYEGQVNDLRTSINSLSNEIAEVRHLVEGLVSGRSDAVAQQQQQPQDTWPQTHGYKSFKSEPARLGPQKSARTLASYLDPRPASAPPYAHQRCAPRDSQALDPELQRAEAILRSMPSQTPHEHLDCSTCQHQPRHGHVSAQGRQRAMPGRRNAPIEEDEGFAEYDDDSILPPQALLSRQLHELESDFASHKNIYIELSEKYRKIDPASNASKRKALAMHLKESVDCLEEKADEIKGLYDLLYTQENTARRRFDQRCPA